MQVEINGKVFPLELMRSPEDISNGMMGRDNLEGCMGFKLKRGFHSFWMKDCLISLDIIFISDGKIQKIYSDCPPCREQDDTKCSHYEGVGDMILEINGGDCIKYDITEGDSILIKE